MRGVSLALMKPSMNKVSHLNESLKSHYDILDSSDDKSYLYIANTICKKYKKYKEYEEIYQQIYLGMHEAILTFDRTKSYNIHQWIIWNINTSLRGLFRSSRRFRRILASEPPCVEEDLNMLTKCIKNNLYTTESVLTKRQSNILFMYYEEGCTLLEISKNLSISVERVRQIRDDAINKLSLEFYNF